MSTPSSSVASQQDEISGFFGLRDRIIRELRAEALPPVEQAQLLVDIGEALLARVTDALLKKLPLEVLREFGRENAPEDQGSVSARLEEIKKHVPDWEEIVRNEIAEGLRAYHAFLDAQGVPPRVKT